MIEFIWDGLSGPNFDLYRGLFNLSAALPTGVLYTPSCIQPQILYYVCVSADYVCQIL